MGTLVFDTFTDVDGTQIDAHTPDVDVSGLGWTSDGIASDMIIQGNRFQNADAGGTALIDPGVVTDFTAEFDWVLGSGDNRIGFIYRQDALPGSNSVNVNMRDPEGDIRVFANGSQIASTAFTFVDNTTHHIEVVFIGDDGALFVDGAGSPALQWTTSVNPSNTLVGLRKAGGALAQLYDNFLVTVPDAGGSRTEVRFIGL